MKIDNFIGDVLSKYTRNTKIENANKTPIKRDEKTESSDNENLEDKVEISQGAKILMELKGEDSDRSDRIKEVKMQIANNTYKPHMDEIANSILKEWKDE